MDVLIRRFQREYETNQNNETNEIFLYLFVCFVILVCFVFSFQHSLTIHSSEKRSKVIIRDPPPLHQRPHLPIIVRFHQIQAAQHEGRYALWQLKRRFVDDAYQENLNRSEQRRSK